jgi:hypothetical protein
MPRPLLLLMTVRTLLVVESVREAGVLSEREYGELTRSVRGEKVSGYA